MLSRLGYEVWTAVSGDDALRRLESGLPDLILLDVIMEGMDGFDVLKEIRTRYRHAELPVIMVTAESERSNVLQAFDQGANDYLTKPLDAQITIARISLQLKLRRALSELKRSQERYALAAQGPASDSGTGTFRTVRFSFHHDGRKCWATMTKNWTPRSTPGLNEYIRMIENSSSYCSVAEPPWIISGLKPKSECSTAMELIAGCCALVSCRSTQPAGRFDSQARSPMSRMQKFEMS